MGLASKKWVLPQKKKWVSALKSGSYFKRKSGSHLQKVGLTPKSGSMPQKVGPCLWKRGSMPLEKWVHASGKVGPCPKKSFHASGKVSTLSTPWLTLSTPWLTLSRPWLTLSRPWPTLSLHSSVYSVDLLTIDTCIHYPVKYMRLLKLHLIKPRISCPVCLNIWI